MQRRMPSGDDAFEPFATRVREHVEARLQSWLATRVAEARTRGPEVLVVAESLSELVLRGGKRWRAALLAAAYEACEGVGGPETVAMAGASLELLQAYLLVHDDWMDGDEERRGGPSVPAMMRKRLGAFADAASVLAGDLASGWAQMLLCELPLAPARVMRAAAELASVQEDVVSGQLLDVGNSPRSVSDVLAMHVLKTASYSVRGPVVMGAALAGAGEDTLVAVRAFGEPLGVAFQLRDDLLGTFGDPKATGKPVGRDVRRGKRTALWAYAMCDARAAGLLERAAREDATDPEVAAAVEAMVACGARRRVEERIAELVAESFAALERARLANGALLASAVVALTERVR
jgi:geranylgeranyl diphosphate synthase, type I